MAEKEYDDPQREIAVAWDSSHSINGMHLEDMGCAIRLYQHLGIDPDSHPVVIKMEKRLGNNLLDVAGHTLLLTLKSLDLPYDTVLKYSDQGNRIYPGMKIGSFSLGHCLIDSDRGSHQWKAEEASDKLAMDKRVSKLYAAACIDSYGHRKIMRLCDYGNEESRLLKEVRLEVSKYKDTIDSASDFL